MANHVHVKARLLSSAAAARMLKLLLLAFTLNGMVMQEAKVHAQEQVAEPTAGLLCISECTTCPLLCSPPPSYHSSPPPPLPPPPYKSPTFESPPLSPYKSPPFELPLPPPRIIYYFPPKSFSAHPPPPPSFYSSSSAPPPPRPKNPPPAPWTYFTGSPPGPLQPTEGGPYRSYPDPYFYASKASSVSQSFCLHTILFLFSLHVMLIFYSEEY